jgi:hypothetical protein
MKTLTFVTIALLPATFIAVSSFLTIMVSLQANRPKTLFSMPMFNWDLDSQETISPNLWIYWVVSIPLTLITAGGWRVWWHYQKIYHARVFQNGSQDDTRLSSTHDVTHSMVLQDLTTGKKGVLIHVSPYSNIKKVA